MAWEDYKRYMKNILWDNEFDLFCDCLKDPLKKTIKILESRIDIDNFILIAKKHGWSLEKTIFQDFDDMFYINKDSDQAIGNHFLHLLWFFYIQELAASIPAHFVNVDDGDMILDMCASPWWKSVQLIDRILSENKKWLVFSNEFNGKRIPALGSNMMRIGAYNNVITKYNASWFGSNMPEFFDKVLLDAPCSGEWTGFKTSSAFKRWKVSVAEKISRTQQMLLVSAVKTCKPWWKIIYSTCTLNDIENEKNVEWILKKYKWIIELEFIELLWSDRWIVHEEISDNVKDSVIRCWPHKQKTWWFFVARFSKILSLWNMVSPEINNQSYQYFNVSRSISKDVISYLEDNWDLDINFDDYCFVDTWKWIYVTSPLFDNVRGLMAYDRVWLAILKWKSRSDRRPVHGFALLFGKYIKTNFINISDDQLQCYVDKKDMNMDGYDNGYYVLKWNDFGVGIVKVVDGVGKNKFVR